MFAVSMLLPQGILPPSPFCDRNGLLIKVLLHSSLFSVTEIQTLTLRPLKMTFPSGLSYLERTSSFDVFTEVKLLLHDSRGPCPRIAAFPAIVEET